MAWLRAEALTMALGRVPEQEAAQRASACLECPERCQKRKAPDPIGWCGKCRCGNRQQARLSRKVWMRGVACPLSRWPEAGSAGA